MILMVGPVNSSLDDGFFFFPLSFVGVGTPEPETFTFVAKRIAYTVLPYMHTHRNLLAQQSHFPDQPHSILRSLSNSEASSLNGLLHIYCSTHQRTHREYRTST
jgi:hypothetical protein